MIRRAATRNGPASAGAPGPRQGLRDAITAQRPEVAREPGEAT